MPLNKERKKLTLFHIVDITNSTYTNNYSNYIYTNQYLY